jgi:5-methyltetrahydrofolate--homocysteine methyltransferase
MEAIRAANFLLNQDDGGSAWIAFNRDPDAALGGARGARASRGGGRRARG